MSLAEWRLSELGWGDRPCSDALKTTQRADIHAQAAQHRRRVKALQGKQRSLKLKRMALMRNSGGGRRAVVGRAFRRCAATPASRAGSSGSAPRSRPGLPFSEPAESGREDHD